MGARAAAPALAAAGCVSTLSDASDSIEILPAPRLRSTQGWRPGSSPRARCRVFPVRSSALRVPATGCQGVVRGLRQGRAKVISQPVPSGLDAGEHGGGLMALRRQATAPVSIAKPNGTCLRARCSSNTQGPPPRPKVDARPAGCNAFRTPRSGASGLPGSGARATSGPAGRGRRSAPAAEAFVFIGTAACSTVAGQLRWRDAGGPRRIEGDVNGHGVAHLTILTAATGPVTARWFLL
jgi:hypothetical protein